MSKIEPAFLNLCEECRREHVILFWIGGLWRCPVCAEAIRKYVKESK